jgi:hypothetical protein
MPPASRYIDDGKALTSFADEVLVRCVRCSTPGRVSATWSPYRWIAAFECASCKLSLSSQMHGWVGPVVLTGRRPCGRCGHKWVAAHQRFDRFPRPVLEHLPVQCPECSYTSQVEVKQQRAYPIDHAVDPHFGMPLHLVQDSRLGSVWAYNERHLNELCAYVRAKLRVRRGGGTRAMFASLPAWMKLAKNRAPVLRCLQRLRALVPGAVATASDCGKVAPEFEP